MTTRTRTGRTRYLAAAVLLVLLLALVAAAMPAGVASAAQEERPAVARLISAALEISPPLARLEAGLQVVPRGSVLTSAGELRPAADLGAWARSRGYARVTPEPSATRSPRAPPRTPRPATGPGATSAGTAPP